MDWNENPKYSHKGKWEKKFKSIMSPDNLITFPQFLVEMIVYNRRRFLKDFPKFELGPKWSNAIQKQVGSLCQQAHAVCDYFPHPDDEPLVEAAFRNYFRCNRVFKIGQYRKTRFTKTGKCNITQDEKNVVLGINAEFQRLLKQRDMYKVVSEEIQEKENKDIKFITTRKSKETKNILNLLRVEEKLQNG